MQRKKSLLAATIVSATLLTGAVAYAASSGVLEGRDDNVGDLQPTTSVQSRDITVFVDPVTGSVTTATSTTGPTTAATSAAVTAPTSTRTSAAVSTTRTTIDDHGGDRPDDDDDNSGSGSGSDDRPHGRDSDDD